MQSFASKIFMAESLVQAIIPAFLALFIGSWSDKFGRKPVMLVTGFGKFSNVFLTFYNTHSIFFFVSLTHDLKIRCKGSIVFLRSIGVFIQIWIKISLLFLPPHTATIHRIPIINKLWAQFSRLGFCDFNHLKKKVCWNLLQVNNFNPRS